MNVNAVMHQAKLLEWKDRVADCRSSGMSVKHWREEKGCSPKTYYRWGQEILGVVQYGVSGAVESAERTDVPC